MRSGLCVAFTGLSLALAGRCTHVAREARLDGGSTNLIRPKRLGTSWRRGRASAPGQQSAGVDKWEVAP